MTVREENVGGVDHLRPTSSRVAAASTRWIEVFAAPGDEREHH